MLGIVGLAIVLFASTNVDDLLVLLGFLSDPRYRVGDVIVGQVLGLAVLFIVSLAGSLVSLVLAPRHVGLLGLLPVLIGLKRLFALWRGTDRNGVERQGTGSGKVLAVAGVTVANGGDNVGVYVPVLATHTGPEIGLIAAVFLVLVAAWIAVASWLVNHRTLGAPIRRYGHLVTPFVLIGLGVLILHEAGSVQLLSASWG